MRLSASLRQDINDLSFRLQIAYGKVGNSRIGVNKLVA